MCAGRLKIGTTAPVGANEVAMFCWRCNIVVVEYIGLCAMCQGIEQAKSIGPGCGGLSCTPAMEAQMQPLARPSLAESVGMQRGMARNGRVIRKSDTMS